MATNNSSNNQFTNNADGFDLSGGTTKRKVTITGADVTLTGSGANTYTMPAATDTLVGRASTDTLTNKDLSSLTNKMQTNLLGYAQITSSVTTSSASPVQVTGLTSTVTVPSGGRSVKVTVYFRSNENTTTAYNHIRLWNGTVGSGTQLQDSQQYLATGGIYPAFGTMTWIGTPTAGSYTYNVSMDTSAGTATFEAASVYPAFIAVEIV